MIRWLYERSLARSIVLLPGHICFMITGEDVASAPGKLSEVTAWCIDISLSVQQKAAGGTGGGKRAIEGVTFHISTADPGALSPYLGDIRGIASTARLSLHIGEKSETAGEGMEVCVAVGKSGREEIAWCIRRMAEEKMEPGEVSEAAIEERLTFHYHPDLVIKTGGSHLTDFLIWQSVYSELFFSDVNWPWFRKTDFLRALRDYQNRVRRFGR
jgi:undecaprenyl diphosphate synthase